MVVLELERNASTDYYLRPRLEAAGLDEVYYRNLLGEPPSAANADLLGEGTVVVICRYLTAAWFNEVRRAAHRLAAVIFFMDDDLPAAATDPTLPGRYRRRVRRYFGRWNGALGDICDRVWVSSAALARRYPGARPVVVPPVPHADAREGEPEPATFFYHGTLTHAREARALRPVVVAVRRRCPHARFEIMADVRSSLLFRGRPGVRVRRTLSWPDYLADTAVNRLAVGLAPLLPSPFNAARAPTKFFDITRAGAAGLYANRAPYAGFVRDGRDGILVEDSPEAWVEAISGALADGERLRALREGARRRCRELRARLLGRTGFRALLEEGPAPAATAGVAP